MSYTDDEGKEPIMKSSSEQCECGNAPLGFTCDTRCPTSGEPFHNPAHQGEVPADEETYY